MGYYDLGLLVEILPGRQMVPYVVGGAGSALMQGRSEGSWNFGAGTVLFLNKKTLTRWEIRDYRFSSGPPEARRSVDNIAFTFTSDELNGSTLDNHGIPRPLLPRTFATLSQAEQENGQSRIYLGIHWAFDKTAGIAQGRRIADEIVSKAARPR